MVIDSIQYDIISSWESYACSSSTITAEAKSSRNRTIAPTRTRVCKSAISMSHMMNVLAHNKTFCVPCLNSSRAFRASQRGLERAMSAPATLYRLHDIPIASSWSLGLRDDFLKLSDRPQRQSQKANCCRSRREIDPDCIACGATRFCVESTSVDTQEHAYHQMQQTTRCFADVGRC
ncbi:hypothetical protein Naga_100001g61 [Nannochloropsis gaditana]|uniref:Uncharacterized protein n=1 Tax=Nannochloropsis gaditana TaxID=72520 RepID=W7TI26_9STRA|nr:hypothetical protein Naga_100001g61 [Nannochloropsis gaditana]